MIFADLLSRNDWGHIENILFMVVLLAIIATFAYAVEKDWF